MPPQAKAGACALAALLAGCNPQAPKSIAAPSASSAPAATPLALHITVQGTARQPVHAIYQIHNRVMYDLLARSGESEGPQGSTRAVFADARIAFHGKDGSTTVAAAPRAMVDQTANSVTLLDHVRARTASGVKLQCDRLVYDRTSETLHGYGNVVIIDPNGFRATGSSFDSDVSLTHMHMI